MERDPRVDPQFGDELLCCGSVTGIFGYSEPALVRVAATGEDGGTRTVEVLARRQT